MIEKIAKPIIARWVKNPKNRRKVARWLLPLVVLFLRSVTASTENKIDDALVEGLDAWSRHI